MAFRSIEEGCAPSRTFPVISVHGTADLLSFYGGYGFEAPLQSVPETLDMWRGVWACDANPVEGELPDTVADFTTVSTFTWEGCRPGAGVFHYRVNMGGHTWPGPTGPWGQILGLHNRDLDTTREALAIFDSFRPGN